MTTVSLNAELAAAARRVRALNERLPEQHRASIAPDWEALLEAVEGIPEWKARRHIAEWVEQMEVRLSGRLLNAPLDLDGEL